jgi:hypothetical protein
MSYAFHIPETQWQHRLRKLKGPGTNLSHPHSQQQDVVGKVQIQPDDRAQLLNEQAQPNSVVPSADRRPQQING